MADEVPENPVPEQTVGEGEEAEIQYEGQPKEGEEIEQQVPGTASQPEEEEPKVKTYAPPNPSIKECIQLNQLMPIVDIDKNIDAISSAIYENDDLLNEFLQKVDNRMKINKEDSEGDFIMCEQNRDGDSYRSPFSNKYYPAAEDDAKYPSEPLRGLEVKLNKMFRLYAKSYYSQGALSSVYCWELGDNLKDGYGVSVLIKNNIDLESRKLKSGSWESSNLVTVTFQDDPSGKKKAKYSLITSVNVVMVIDNKICGHIVISGTVARSSHYSKIVKDYVNDEDNIKNIGVLIEDMEGGIRNSIEAIYCQKSKEIIDKARWNPTMGKPRMAQAMKLKEAWKGGFKP